MKKGDVFGVGNRNYIITGESQSIGERQQLGEIKRSGPIQKVTLYVGLNRGVSSGKCGQQPAKYKPQTVIDTFLHTREIQTGDPSRVGATATPAKGVFRGGSENTWIIEVLYEKNHHEQTWGKFKKNMLRAGEALSRRFCQQEIMAVVKNGADEERWTLTPKKRE